jgi:hypothetical protein
MVNNFTIELPCFRLGIWKLRDKRRDVEKEDAPYVTTKRLQFIYYEIVTRAKDGKKSW